MLFDASETLFSAQTLLWLAASVIAALLLFGSINRRRSRLTDSLRRYVDKNQHGGDVSRSEQDETSPSE